MGILLQLGINYLYLLMLLGVLNSFIKMKFRISVCYLFS